MRTLASVLMLSTFALSSANGPSPAFPGEDIPLEDLPEEIVASMEVRAKFLGSLPSSELGESFVVEDAVRWTPGTSVRVAFMGGSSQLHREIAEATKVITDACNIKLDFGYETASNSFRSWSTNDQSYQAEIRVSFDQGGYWSLVGRDSVDATIGNPASPSGGRPNQRSLNLGGFHLQKPSTWIGTTRHEFMHALGFHHEHQHPIGTCENEFRWQDDPGYIPTQNAQGGYITDPNGKRPGIYTYLAGYPNYWSRSKVDHNLRALPPEGLSASPHIDRGSIMLYRFPALFYRSNPSSCAPTGPGQDLSADDIAGLQLLYPSETPAIENIVRSQERLFQAVLKEGKLPNPLRETYQNKLKSLK